MGQRRTVSTENCPDPSLCSKQTLFQVIECWGYFYTIKDIRMLDQVDLGGKYILELHNSNNINSLENFKVTLSLNHIYSKYMKPSDRIKI